MPYHSKFQDLPTEAINPDTLAIDKMPTLDIIDLIGVEDRRVVSAVHKERERIAHGVEILVSALKKGGRLFLVGAGTSGRLGIVEAAEMPLTFGTSPKLVQAVMAGGQDAVFHTREGVEDNFEEGARTISRLRVSKKDAVIGVSASGITQFVRGALTAARTRGARIIFVTCWPGTELQNYVDLIIAPAVGPEVIAGSTRLKAGTATKMVLNMLTTIAMIRVGKTYGNLMVDVHTGSEKLRDRARRKRCGGCARPMIRCATRSAKTSSRRSGSSSRAARDREIVRAKARTQPLLCGLKPALTDVSAAGTPPRDPVRRSRRGAPAAASTAPGATRDPRARAGRSPPCAARGRAAAPARP
jgi:N-acetylmuramic acid 6-phosphate etherase